MLTSLRRIVQEVNSVKNYAEALKLIVDRVADEMNTDVCTIYMWDDSTQRFVFAATRGLNQDLCGKVSLSRDEGLVGLVGMREEPLNLERADAHPRFHFMAGIGEELYNAFLGVPIIHQRRVLGVLVVQQAARRRFDEAEEAFLVTLSAQLAGVIAHAEASGALHDVDNRQELGQRPNAKFQGIGAVRGTAIGTAVVASPQANLEAVPSRLADDIPKEIEHYNRAIDAVRMDIWRLREKLSGRLRPEERALFDVYLGMLNDNALGNEVIERIRAGEWAQGALSQVILEHVQTFEMMEDAYLRERAVDVKDLGRRVLSYMQNANQGEQEYPDNTILVGEELTASMLGEVPKDKLIGLISVQGSGNSHVAIMARAMGIPTVMGAMDLPYARLEGRQLILDGYAGTVFANPGEELLEHYYEVLEQERQELDALYDLRDLPCEMLDGHRIELVVNTGLNSDVGRSLDHGAEGVGLYRTEMPFMIRERFPSEEEQRRIYREHLQAFAPNPVTMRTLDIGGDKALPYFPIQEENPFLGWRGIRVTLDHPEIFLVQCRAMIRANEGLGNLKIMLPMISHVAELDEALALIYRCYDELVEEGIESPMPKIGVMVEVPAAVYQARQLARRVDFLSVGSNDLTQYLLAVDRNNARVADLYHQYHPAVLQALASIAADAKFEGKDLSICGELAGDPGASILLAAMGYKSLSMSANNLPRVKSVLRQVSMEQATGLLETVLLMDNSRDVQRCVDGLIRKLGLSRMFQSSDA
ncbi:MAG: hypothetical protein RL336_1665 [Pseudomonadota bacterium]|jgi:phosphotransferase system enzyme I (PtsP)